jgi:speckle-type POZ protein
LARYGLDGLKLICEGKLSGGIDVDTVATTLALAEQHNCSLLKVSTSSLGRLKLWTDGYKHLAERYPLVLAEFLRAARGRRN